MNLAKYFKNIEKVKEIWQLLGVKSKVSYPEDGSDNFFLVEDKSFWFQHRNNCIEEIMKLYPPNGVVFDVGGGNGFVSYAIEKSGNTPVLIEPDLKGIINAKKRGFKNLINTSFQDLDIVPNTISSIGLFDVLEHIENDDAFLKNIHKILKKEGTLYLTVPAYNFLWSNEDDHDGHYRRYTNKNLVKLLKKNNFKVCYSTYFFSILPLPIFLLRAIPSWFSKSKKSFDDEKNEHELGAMNSIFSYIFNKELSVIKKNKRISFGGSLLIVAKKI